MKKMVSRDKLKIAMIGHKRIPSREGGVEVAVEELSERMVDKGHSVTVYSRKGHHVSGKEFDELINNTELKKYKGINIITVPTIKCRGLAAVSSSFFATMKALFGNYDCIHYHAEGSCVMLFIPHIFKIRTVATIHGLDWQRNKWGGFAAWYLKLGERIAVQYVDEIIVLSKNVQRYFKETYNRDTVYIPNGISRPEIYNNDVIKQKWNLEKNGYLLFLGRIVPEKGLQYLIEAFMQVTTDKKLIIAGGASDTDKFMYNMKNITKEDERILFTGFVKEQVLEELYSNAYVYILPSDIEGMPISLLEAMSYGNCCLVSDIPECTEVTQDKAVSFKKSSVEDLKVKLQELLNKPEMVKKYKNNASEFVCSKYNWDDIVERTLLLYRA